MPPILRLWIVFSTNVKSNTLTPTSKGSKKIGKQKHFQFIYLNSCPVSVQKICRITIFAEIYERRKFEHEPGRQVSIDNAGFIQAYAYSGCWSLKKKNT